MRYYQNFSNDYIKFLQTEHLAKFISLIPYKQSSVLDPSKVVEALELSELDFEGEKVLFQAE